jgi:hypothetical protein
VTETYTLADYARLAGDNKLKAGVIDILAVNGVLLSAIPWAKKAALMVEQIRTKSLPTVGTRKIGGEWTATKGLTDVIQDRAVDLGNKIEIDKLLLAADSVVDQRKLQIELFTKAMAVKFNHLFYTGVPTTEAGYDSLTGVWYRLVNDLPSSQSIAAGSLDVSPDATSLAANQLALIDKIHEMLSVMPDGCDFLCMNRIMKLRLNSALRASGMLATTQDSYARTFETFGAGGPKILDLGTTDPLDQSNNYIIPNTELANGSALSGATFTSIVGVKIDETHLGGWNIYPIDVDDAGLSREDGVTHRIFIDWPVGVYMLSPFSAARVYGIQAA